MKATITDELGKAVTTIKSPKAKVHKMPELPSVEEYNYRVVEGPSMYESTIDLPF